MALVRCKVVLLLLAAACCFPRSAAACSVCGCGDPLLPATDATPVAGALRVDLLGEHLTATARSDDDPRYIEALRQFTLRATAAYSPTDRLAFVLQAPLVWKFWRLEGAGKSARPVGLGDIDVGARLFVFELTSLARQRRQSLGVTAGSSLPTGPDDSTAGGARIDQHAQLGTGAFGPYAGLIYRWQGDPLSWFGSFSTRTHTTNSFGYRFGTALLWSLLGQYQLGDSVVLSLGVDGRMAVRDTSNGEAQLDTGGLVLSLTPGGLVRLHRELWFTARVQVPVLTHLFGEQTVGPVVTGGLEYAVF